MDPDPAKATTTSDLTGSRDTNPLISVVVVSPLLWSALQNKWNGITYEPPNSTIAVTLSASTREQIVPEHVIGVFVVEFSLFGQ